MNILIKKFILIFIINTKLVLAPTFDPKWHLKSGCGCWGRVLELHLSYRYAPAWGGLPKFSPNPRWVSTGVYTCKTGRCKIPKKLQSPHTRPFVQNCFLSPLFQDHLPSVAMFEGLGFVKALKLSPYDFYHLVASTLKQLCGGKVGKMQIPKRRANLGLSCKFASSINCHQALAFNLFPISLFFNLSPNPNCLSFSDFVSFYFFTSPPTPFVCIFWWWKVVNFQQVLYGFLKSCHEEYKFVT